MGRDMEDVAEEVNSLSSSNIEGIPPDLFHRYVKMRHKLDEQASSIEGITSMLARFDKCGDDTIDVDPVALAKIHKMLNTNILNIWEILDDFIYLVRAKSELEKLE